MNQIRVIICYKRNNVSEIIKIKDICFRKKKFGKKSVGLGNPSKSGDLIGPLH